MTAVTQPLRDERKKLLRLGAVRRNACRTSGRGVVPLLPSDLDQE